MAGTAHIRPSGERPSNMAVVRRGLSVLVWLVLSLGAAAAYLAWTTPLYRASTSILLDPQGSSELESNAGLRESVDLIESRVRLVSSPAVLDGVVQRQRLADDPEFTEEREPLLLRLRRLIGLDVPELSAAPFEQRLRAALAERLDVKRSGDTSIIDVAIMSRDPVKAARLADAVAAAFIEAQSATAPPAPGGEDNPLRAVLREFEETLRANARQLESLKTKGSALAGSAGQSGEQQLIDLNGALARARSALTEARARLEQVERAVRSGRPDALPDNLHSGVIGTLRSQSAYAQRRRDELAGFLGPRHPELVEAQRDLREAQALIRDELRRMATALRRDVEAGRTAESAAVRALEAKQREISEANEARAELRALERAVQTERAWYDRLRAAAEIPRQEAAPAPAVRQLAPAILPLRPASPDAYAVLLVAAALGLALGLLTPIRREHPARTQATRSVLETGLEDGPAASQAATIEEPDPKRVRQTEPPAEIKGGGLPDGKGAQEPGPTAEKNPGEQDPEVIVPGSPASTSGPTEPEYTYRRRFHIAEVAVPPTGSPAAPDIPVEETKAETPASPEDRALTKAPSEKPVATESRAAAEGPADLSAPASRDRYVRRFHFGRPMKPAE